MKKRYENVEPPQMGGHRTLIEQLAMHQNFILH